VSQPNIDLVRRNHDAYNRRDLETYLDTVAPDVVFQSRFSGLNQRVYRGHDGVRRYFEELDEIWSSYEMRLERVLEVGDLVIALFQLQAVGRESGLELQEQSGVVFTLADGKVVAIDAFASHADALDAAHTAVARRSFEAISSKDLDALLALYDPEIEFLPLTGMQVELGGYTGHAGVRRYLQEAAEVWDEMLPHVDDLHTVGDNVVILGSCAVRGRGSGAVSDNSMAWVLTFRDGKVLRHQAYRTSDEALEAVGLQD
jgi:uncharacterized protein